MCFVWIWEQTAIISLYSINWLVCITETECVYCAVRTESLYVIRSILASAGLVIANKVEFSSTISVLYMNTNCATQNDVYSYFPQSLPDKMPNLAKTFPFHIFCTSLLLTVWWTVSAVSYMLMKTCKNFVNSELVTTLTMQAEMWRHVVQFRCSDVQMFWGLVVLSLGKRKTDF
jgi:hypothetical protein